jgi:hypothetical protein
MKMVMPGILTLSDWRSEVEPSWRLEPFSKEQFSGQMTEPLLRIRATPGPKNAEYIMPPYPPHQGFPGREPWTAPDLNTFFSIIVTLYIRRSNAEEDGAQ